MSDIATFITQTANGSGIVGDWAWDETGDLIAGYDLQTAIAICLFTDCLATSDFVLTDRSQDRRGWWGDQFYNQSVGSNIWQLMRADRTPATLSLIQGYAQIALQPLVDLGLIAPPTIQAFFLNRNGVELVVTVTEPMGTSQQYSWAWTPNA